MKKHLLVLSLCLSSWSHYCQNLSDIKPVTTKGIYSNPIVSPTQEYVLLTGPKFDGVYLLNLKTQNTTPISKVAGSGYGYSWSEDGNSFFYKEKKENDYVSNSEVICYNIKTKSSQKVAINHNYLPSYKGNTPGNNLVIFTNITTLKIEAKDLNTSKSWIVTNDEGQFYNALLSHDGKKVAVHNGAEIYIYNSDGSGLISKIGTGIATSWSKDDKYLIGFMDESKNGHEVSNSDLYLYDVKTSKSEKITTTDNAFEMFPSFFDTDKIIFADDKTGQIFTSKIKL